MTISSSTSSSRQLHGSPPKWQQVLAEVEARFQAGEYAPDAPFPTLGQLGQAHGVSDITARRVFRELKAKGLIVTRGRRGTFTASASRRQRLFICGPHLPLTTLVGGQDAEFYHKFHEHYHRHQLDRVFELHTITAEFCLANPHLIADATLFVMMESLLAVQGSSAVPDPGRLAFFRDHGKAIIFRSLLEPMPGLRQVHIDLRQGMKQVTRHLISQGHRHLAILTGSLSNLWFKPRFEGFLDELTRHGLPCDPAYIHITRGMDPKQDHDAMDKLMALRPRPTAVVCANDSRALHVLQYCKARGLGVPQDIAVTGLDNTLESALTSPSLTTLDHRFDEMVKVMFELANDIRQGRDLTKNHDQVIHPHLIVRESSATHPPDAPSTPDKPPAT